MRRATVYDVAERAGVSIATVSCTYWQPSRVRESTRLKVLEVAKRLNYIPSASARNLARGRVGALGLYSFDFCPVRSLEQGCEDGQEREGETDICTYPLYADEVERGFQQACWQMGQAVLLGGSTGSNPTRSVVDMAGRVDGLALLSWLGDISTLQRLATIMPVVMLAQNPGDLPVLYVSADNYAGLGELVDHLVGVHGAKRIEYVGSMIDPEMRERFHVIQERLTQLGRPVPLMPVDEGFAAKQPFQSVKAMQLARDLPDALVCENDQTALAVINFLRGLGTRVPDDVMVTGADGILAGRFSDPTLTTVQLPMQRIGNIAAHELARQEGKPWTKTKSVLVSEKLKIRQSCGCERPVIHVSDC